MARNENFRAGWGANAAQIKHDIKAGRGGDKPSVFEPAAGPVGADEQAGGARGSARLLGVERRARMRSRPQRRRAKAADPTLSRDGWRKDAGVLAAFAALGVVFLVAAMTASIF